MLNHWIQELQILGELHKGTLHALEELARERVLQVHHDQFRGALENLRDQSRLGLSHKNG